MHWKKLAAAGGVAIALLAAALVALVYSIPTETIRRELVRMVEDATGRRFQASEELHVSVFPSIGLELRDVALANPDWARERELATLAALTLRLDLLPLLFGEVRIGRFVLDEPRIHLEIDAEGRRSWSFAAADPPASTSGAQGGTTGASGDGGAEIGLGLLEIRNATIRLEDARTGSSAEVSGLHARLAGLGALQEAVGTTKISGRVEIGGLRLGTARADAAGAGSGDSTRPGAWSREPIDASVLRLANADLEIKASEVVVGGFRIDAAKIEAKLEAGRLALSLPEIRLYGGSASGRLDIDAAAGDGRLEVDLALRAEGIDVLELLTDAAGFERLEGTGLLEARAGARGQSVYDIVQSLSGYGSLRIEDGAIEAFDAMSIIRDWGARLTGGEHRSRSEFGELSATFEIERGIVSNGDLVVRTPFLRVNGAGSIDLPQRAIDYRLTPRLVATAESSGDVDSRTGIGVPVSVQGPWHDVEVRTGMDALADAGRDGAGRALGAGEHGIEKAVRKATKLFDRALGDKENAVSSGSSDSDPERKESKRPLGRFR